MNDTTNPPHSKPNTQGQLLLELTAISGEYPAENIPRIIPAPSYAKKVLSSLASDGLIRMVNNKDIRGYRLGIRGKRKLLTENPARYCGVLDGESEMSRMRGNLIRRQRLHSLAEINTLMYNAGVEVFQDTKPPIYLPNPPNAPSQTAQENAGDAKPLKVKQHRPPKTHSQPPGTPKQKYVGGNTASTITAPCFYTSREQKGQAANAIRGSRATGTLLTPTDVYAVYNTGDIKSTWSVDVEQRLKAEVQDYICRQLLVHQYSGEQVNGIMVGKDLGILEKYLDIKEKYRTGYHLFNKVFSSFYFITDDIQGEAQLKLLCDKGRLISFEAAIHKGLLPKNKRYPIEHDALTEDGNPVLFCCLLDIPRLIRFKSGVTLHEKIGKVIAFDFQREMLERYLDDKAEVIRSLDFDKFAGRFFAVGGGADR